MLVQESNGHALVGEFINNTAKIGQRAGEAINRRDNELVTVAHIGHTLPKPGTLGLSVAGNLIFKEPVNTSRRIE